MIIIEMSLLNNGSEFIKAKKQCLHTKYVKAS